MLWVLKKNRLDEKVLLSTQNTCFNRLGEKIITILRLKKNCLNGPMNNNAHCAFLRLHAVGHHVRPYVGVRQF